MWLEKDDEQQNQGKQSTADTSVGSGGGSGISTPSSGSNTSQGNPSTISPSASAQPTQQFATINDYLGANKQQGEDLGQKVTSSLSDSQTQDKSAIDTAANNTTNEINAGTVNYDSGLVNKAKSDPTAVTGNQTDLNSFLNQWNAQYGGPQSFETSDQYGNATTAASDANTKAQELSDTGGREQLIGDQFGVQGQGNKGLDQAVLQNSSYFPQVQQQQQGLASVQDYLNNKATDVDAAATTGQAVSDATKTATQGAFTNNLSDFQNKINAETAAASAPAQTSATQFQTDLASGDPTKVIADLKQADPNVDATTIQQYLTAMNVQTGKPTDLSQFYNFNPATAINNADAATGQDYVNAAAYGKLTGTDYSGVLDPNNAAQAGTAPSAVSGFQTPTNVGDYLKTQYINSLLTAGGGSALTPAAPATNGVAGIPGTAATGPSFKSQIGVPGLENIAIPSNIAPDTAKTLVSVFNSPLTNTGSYHEGVLYDAANRISQLKGLVANGQLTKDQYSTYAQPLITYAQNLGKQWLQQDTSGAAQSTLNSAVNKLTQAIG